MISKYLVLTLFLLTIFSSTCNASWLLYHKPEFRGHVVDIDTKEPIEGVVVVAIYYKSTLNPPAGSYSNVIHVKETLTDKNGGFYFPAYTTFIHPLAYSGNCEFLIYKAGYGNLGKEPVEEELSGKANKTFERKALWNNNLVFRFLPNGTIEVPKLTNIQDMKNSWGNAGIWGAEIDKSEVPLLYNMVTKEEQTIFIKGR